MEIDQLNITLRRATPDDAGFVESLRNQPSSVRFQASPRRPRDVIAAMMAETVNTPLDRSAVGRFHWIGIRDNQPVAMVQIAIDQRDHSQHAATLGYTVAESWQGQGIATDMVRSILPIVFNSKGLAIERLEAVAAVGNVASCRVLEKSGFQFEGIQRGLLLIAGSRVDHACYALLNTDDLVRRMYS